MQRIYTSLRAVFGVGSKRVCVDLNTWVRSANAQLRTTTKVLHPNASSKGVMGVTVERSRGSRFA